MFKWQKLGKIFDPREHPRWWLHEFAQAPATLLFDNLLRVYFSGRPAPDADGQYVSYTGFADFDRRDPMKLLRVSDEPVLSLGGLGCFDEHGVYPASFIRRGGYTLMYYAGWKRCQSVRFDTAIGLAYSAGEDAVDFVRAGRGPIVGASRYEPFVLSGPKVRVFNGAWWLFYIAGREWRMIDGRTEPIYKIRVARSNNGIDWTPHNANLIADVLGDDEVQSGPDVHLGADGIYHMLFCFREAGHHPDREGGLRIGYAWSENLTTWHRDDAQAGITIDPDPEAWDGQHIRYPHVFDLDGEQYMLFNGNEFGRHGFGLARGVG